MTPLPLGILAASGTAAGVPAYDLLETEILTGTQASVTFSSLNSTYGADYQHLQIRYTARGNRSSVEDFPTLTFNNLAATHNSHGLRGNGSSVFSYYNPSNYVDLGTAPANNATANIFAGGVLDILDPFSTSKNTTLRHLTGDLQKNEVRLISGLYISTAAIDEIDIGLVYASYVAGSRFSLYGLRSA